MIKVLGKSLSLFCDLTYYRMLASHKANLYIVYEKNISEGIKVGIDRNSFKPIVVDG